MSKTTSYNKHLTRVYLMERAHFAELRKAKVAGKRRKDTDQESLSDTLLRRRKILHPFILDVLLEVEKKHISQFIITIPPDNVNVRDLTVFNEYNEVLTASLGGRWCVQVVTSVKNTGTPGWLFNLQ